MTVASLQYPHWTVAVQSFVVGIAYQVVYGLLFSCLLSGVFVNLVSVLGGNLGWSDRTLFAIIQTLMVNLQNTFAYMVFALPLFDKYRLPRTTAQEPSEALVRSTILGLIVKFFMNPLAVYFLYYPLFFSFGNSLASLSAPLPSLQSLAV